MNMPHQTGTKFLSVILVYLLYGGQAFRREKKVKTVEQSKS